MYLPVEPGRLIEDALYIKLTSIPNFLSNFIWYLFSSSARTMRKSPQIQQSQFQTRTVTSENVAQGNGNINIFWKDSRWFFRQCLRIFFIFYDQSKKWLFGKLHLCPSI